MAFTPEQRAKAADTQRRNREAAKAAAVASAGGDVAPVEPGKAKTPPSMAKELGLLVNGVNDALVALPWTREDALSADECTALVTGLDKAQQGNKRIKRFLGQSTEGSGIIALALALLAIALPRLARHGLLPGMRKPTPAEQLAAEHWRAAGAPRPPTPEEWGQLVVGAQQQLDRQAQHVNVAAPAVPVG